MSLFKRSKLTKRKAIEIASQYGVEDLVKAAMTGSWFGIGAMSPKDALEDNDIWVDEETLEIL